MRVVTGSREQCCSAGVGIRGGHCRARVLGSLLGIITIVSLCASVPLNSYASDSGSEVTDGDQGRLAEIIVTANKREENLQTVPIVVNALSGDELDSAGIGDTSQLALRVPGLNIQASSNGVNPHLRGVGLTATNAGNENSIATYIDGVYIANPSASLFHLNSIQQVEVYKGPQGTLFGRNATGGLINIRTRDPSQTFSGKVSVGYGNYQTVNTQAYVTGGIANDLAADLSVQYSNQGEGYGRNLYSGRDVNKTRDIAARSKWLYTPTESDRIELALDFTRTDSSAFGYSLVPGTVSNYGTGPTLASQRPDLARYFASGAVNPNWIVGDPYTHVGGDWDQNSHYDPSYSYKQGGGALTIKHDFGFAQLSSISAYRRTNKFTGFSSEVLPAPILDTYWWEPSRQASQELQLASADSRVKWVGGLYYLNAAVSKYPGQDLVGTTVAPLSALQFSHRSTINSAAAYAQATIPIWDRTNLTAGARYTSELRGMEGSTNLIFAPSAPPVRTNVVDASHRFQKPTWRLALDHQFTDELFAYLSYNRGFKSGLYNTAPPNPKPINPETLDAYETGLKMDLLQRRLRINASAFYYDYSNMQVTTFNQTTAVQGNSGKSKIYGLDLDLESSVTDHLTLSAGIEWLHDEFTSYPGVQFAQPLPASAGGGNAFTVGDGRGRQLPYTPKFTGNIAADYLTPIASDGQTLKGELSYYYNTGYYPFPDNVIKAPNNRQLNAQLTWSSSSSHTRITAFGKNLTNTVYPTFIFEVFNPGGQAAWSLAPPRTFGLNIEYSF